MTPTHLKYINLLIVCLFLCLFSCSTNSSPDDIVVDFVSEAEHAVEDRNGRKLRGLISENYHDEKGRRKEDVASTASGYLFRNKSLHVFSRISEVTQTTEGEISATLLVALAGKPINDVSVLPTLNADFYWFEIKLFQEGKDWKLGSVLWRQAMVNDFLNN